MRTPTKGERHGADDPGRLETAELLSDHHAHGRLSQEEFEQRLGAALTAQTSSELGRLLADLPLRRDVEPAVAPRRRRGLSSRGARVIREAVANTGVVGGLAALSAATDAAAPYTGHAVFVFTFGVGIFGYVAGRVAAVLTKRAPETGPAVDSGSEH